MASEQQSEPDVLIVEDQPDVRDTLADLLELEGYRVVTAANGAEALALLQQSAPPHVILRDLRMPVMNGWAFRQEQQASPVLALIPVVVISGERDVSAAASELQAAGHLAKPIEIQELLAVLERFRP
jgi:two-component system chemotaxis response regulator CheY